MKFPGSWKKPEIGDMREEAVFVRLFFLNLDNAKYPPRNKMRQSSFSKVRTIEDAMSSGKLISYSQFVQLEGMRGLLAAENEEGVRKAYDKYVLDFQSTVLDKFFSMNHKEVWYKERMNHKNETKERLEKFRNQLDGGELDDVCLEETDEIVNEGEDRQVRTMPTSLKMPDCLKAAASEDIDGSIIVISNVAPSITEEVLWEAIKGIIGDEAVSMSIEVPSSDKGYFRSGWLVVKTPTELLARVANDMEQKLGLEPKVYCSPAPSTSRTRTIRITEEGFNAQERIQFDFEQVQKFVHFLDKIAEIEDCPVVGLSGTIHHQLDIFLLYLRKVHNACYYCGIICHSPLELLRQCGHIHLRSKGASENSDFLKSFDQKISNLFSFFSREPPQIDNLIENRLVVKVDDGKFRCSSCNKLFKGSDFVIKHIKLKHEDLKNLLELEISDLQKFYNSTMLLQVVPLIPLNYSKKRDRPLSPPINQSVIPSKRPILRYVDLDAPATGEVEINYD